MVLHAEISTTHLRTIITWQHDDELYSDVLFEDPFCNPQLEVSVVLCSPPLPWAMGLSLSGVQQRHSPRGCQSAAAEDSHVPYHTHH